MASVSKRTWNHNGAEKTAWVVRYTDGAGKRRLKTFDLKKEADKFRLRTEVEIEQGEHVPTAESVTIARLATLYLEDVEARAADGRIGVARFRNLTMYVRSSIVPNLGTTRISDLNAAMVEDLYKTLQKKNGQCSRTAKDRVMILKLMQDFAIRRGFLAKRPVDIAMRELRGVKRRKIRCFTAEEVGRLLAAAAETATARRERTAPMIACFVNLAAFCGLRYGEILGLKRENVDIEGRILRVRHSLCPYVGLKGPKTAAGIRDVPMPSHVATMLNDWIETNYVENVDNLVFRNMVGNEIKPSSFHSKHWHPLLKRAGLFEGERLRFHALRHFAASFMIAHNLPVTEVAEMLGHANFDVTLQVYAHPVLPKHYRHAAIDRMAESLVSPPQHNMLPCHA